MDYSLEENLGDTPRPGPSLSFYTSLHLATSGLPLWNTTACPRRAYSEPAGVNRLDSMLRSRDDAVSYIISANLRPRTMHQVARTCFLTGKHQPANIKMNKWFRNFSVHLVEQRNSKSFDGQELQLRINIPRCRSLFSFQRRPKENVPTLNFGFQADGDSKAR